MLAAETMAGVEKPVVEGPVDGNVFAVVGAVRRALRRAGLKAQLAEFDEKWKAAGSYDGVLAFCMEFVDFDL